MSRRLWSTWLFVLCCLVSNVALASSFEVFGVHPEAMAEVSSRVAYAEDGAASFYNPGGLALGRDNRLELSVARNWSYLDANKVRRELSDPYSGTMTLAVGVPLEGPLHERLRFGIAMHALSSTLMRLRPQRQTTPFFPYYDNRTQRLVLMPTLAARITDRIGIGLGANVLAGVQGPVDVREGQSRAMESHIVEEATALLRVVAGIRWDLSDRLQLGLAYRQRFGVPLTITTEADIGGVPLVVDVSSAEALFDPATVVVGGRVFIGDRLSIELDLGYHRWSTWQGPLLFVDTTVSALAIASKPPRDVFRDTFSAKGASTWDVFHSATAALRLHVGAGMETSMIDRAVQQGRSNYLDGMKILLGLGVSASFFKVLGNDLRISAGVQTQHVSTYEQDKVVCSAQPCPPSTVVGPDALNPSVGIDNPGYPTLRGGGQVMVGSLGIGVSY